MSVIKEGEPRIAGLSRLGLCVLLSHTLVRGFIFIMVLFGNLGWFFFCFFFFFFFWYSRVIASYSESLAPSSKAELFGDWRREARVQCHLRKTFTHKNFHVNIAAEDFSQLLLGSSGLNR